MSGMIGMWLGANAANRMKGLVLCNTAAKIGNAETWNARIALVHDQGMAAVAPGAPIPVEAPSKPKKKPPPPPPPLETALSTDPSPSFQPATFLATSKAAERYAADLVAGARVEEVWPHAVERTRESVMEWLAVREEETG